MIRIRVAIALAALFLATGRLDLIGPDLAAAVELPRQRRPRKAYGPRLDPNFLSNRAGAAPGRRQQNYPRALQIALRCHR
jgi:hypothetical protein